MTPKEIIELLESGFVSEETIIKISSDAEGNYIEPIDSYYVDKENNHITLYPR